MLTGKLSDDQVVVEIYLVNVDIAGQFVVRSSGGLTLFSQHAGKRIWRNALNGYRRYGA